MNYIFLKKDTKEKQTRTDVLKNQVIDCFNHALSKASPEKLVAEVVSDCQLIKQIKVTKKKITVFAFGKASGYMLKGLDNALADDCLNGLLASNVVPEGLNSNIKVFNAGHPLPNEQSLKAGRYAIDLAEKMTENDIAICLISGGGSALFEAPNEGISMALQQKLSKNLLELGMEDDEINLFRSLFSRIKGGKLAKLIAPAAIINIIISDDINNKLEAIASGPTVVSTTTKEKIATVYQKWCLSKNLPSKISEKIKKLINDYQINQSDNQSISNRIILDNNAFLTHLKGTFTQLIKNCEVTIYEQKLSNFDKDFSVFNQYIKNKIAKNKKENFIVIGGGEMPVCALENSLGGRNQHFAAKMLQAFDSENDWLFASIATDGQDYIKGITGAIVSALDNEHCQKEGIDVNHFIEKTNSHDLHHQIGSHIYCQTGTGFNVSDIYIFLFFPKT